MRELVYLLSVWCVMLYLVGVATGWIARHATQQALHRQSAMYIVRTGGRPPLGAVRGIGILAWGTVVALVVAVASIAEYLGIRPPGAADFTFAMFFIGVLPACVAGAALGTAIGVARRDELRVSSWTRSPRVSLSFASAVILLAILGV